MLSVGNLCESIRMFSVPVLQFFCNRSLNLKKEKALFFLWIIVLPQLLCLFLIFLFIICEVFFFFFHFSQMPCISVMPQGHRQSQSLNCLKCSWILTGLETPLKKLWVGGKELMGEFILGTAGRHVLILWSRSETFMVLILHRFPPISWRGSRTDWYDFICHYWLGLYFSQILPLAAELYKTISHLVNSARISPLVISFSGFQCPSDTGCVQVFQMFTESDFFCTRNWIVLIQGQQTLAADLSAPQPCSRADLAAHRLLGTAWAWCSSFAQQETERGGHAPSFSSCEPFSFPRKPCSH